MNAYLGELRPDSEGLETVPLPAEEIMDIIYHYMPTSWKNKISEQGFNYADSTIKEKTDLFETRVEILVPKEEKKKASAGAKKANKKSANKHKQEDSNSSVIDSSEDFPV